MGSLPKIIVAAFVVLVGAFGAWRFWAGEKAPVVSALKSSWYVEDLEWTTFDGAWRAEATLRVKRAQTASSTANELLSAFCGSMLTELPGTEGKAIERKNVFRLDLNFIVPNGDAKAFPRNVPIAVLDGACQMDLFGDNFFPTYPGTLSAWYLANSGLQKTNGDVQRTVVFLLRPNAQANLMDFPFLDACRAVAADPYARQPVTHPVSGLEIPSIEDGPITIVVRDGTGGVVSVGRFVSEKFLIHGTECEAAP